MKKKLLRKTKKRISQEQQERRDKNKANQLMARQALGFDKLRISKKLI